MPEESISTRKDLLDLLVSKLTDFVMVLTDVEGNFTSWHPGVEREFGYTREEFIGLNLETLFPPAERGRGAGRRELDEAAEAGRDSDTRWLVNKAGQPLFVEGVTIALRDQNGRLLGFGKALRDVTGQKTADENLRALASGLEQSPVMVRRFDGVIEHWTEGCEHLYGWTAQEALGKVAYELLKTTFPQPLEKIERQLLVSGAWRGELEQTRRDGTRVFISAHWVLLPDQSGGPPTIIATHTDITTRLEVQRELEMAHEELKRMTLELERSNEELEGFAWIASHDLSAPITSTRWLVDLLSMRHAEQLNDEGQKCLKQIVSNLERMGDLVQGVLAHAQVGRSAIGSSNSTEAGAALDAAIANLQRDIETSRATITQDALPRLYIDPRALTQLFQNLLSNAIKYRRPKFAPAIKITAEPQGSMWLLRIEDNGTGIDPEWLERIFLPLQRLHGSEIAGSGLGLATCKKIVTRAGGRIWVESRVGSGSRFLFTLPGSSRPNREVPDHGDHTDVLDPNDTNLLRDRIKGQTDEHALPPRLEDEGQSGG